MQASYSCTESSVSKTTTAYYPSRHIYTHDKVSVKGVADTFNYLERLFDVDSKQKGVSDKQKEQIEEAIEPYKQEYKQIRAKIKDARKHNGYDIVKLNNVFDFMAGYQ